VRGLILFDIDGTLLQAGDRDHQRAFVSAMKQVYGLPATLDGVPLAGMLDSQIARLALSRQGLSDEEIDADLGRMIAAMGEHYAAAVAEQSRLERVLPGVVDLSERLRDGRFALGVLTGNAREVAHVKLASAGILKYFEFGAFGDSARERGYLVEVAWREAQARYGTRFAPEQTLLIGDTPRDIEAARANGASVVAVATGRYSVEDLSAHEPDAVFADLSDVDAVVAAVEQITG
jgi:phosphoglycolate phosphatase-like HAD superfamily hydrolase